MVYLYTKNKGQRYWNHNKYSIGIIISIRSKIFIFI